MMGAVYPPGEDSYLLAKYVKSLVYGQVLDMGTGSGIQAEIAALKPEVVKVTAVDINPKALKKAEERVRDSKVLMKIKFKTSDLFSDVTSKFDWIIFNPPYLPSEGQKDEISWAGGKTGSELISRFLIEARNFLKSDGSILLIYSSLSNIKDYKFPYYNWEILEEKNLFFESIYCALITPFLDPLLNQQ